MESLGNSPVFMPGLASHWPALRLWRGPSGLSRLKELCGGVKTQVMISREDRFVGDMQHLMLLECTFADFLDGKLELCTPSTQQEGTEDRGQAGGARAGEGAPTSSLPPCPHRLYAYLAQCPIAGPSHDRKGLQPGPLHGLMQDIELPPMLEGVNQVNFWASPRTTQSSLHYDPYQNLLVVATGSKTVRLVPPDATPLLKPQPIYHDSANHSPASLAAPDPQHFPELSQALPSLLQIHTLQAGDGLYIPEGWWHQVESSEGTLAVNFWWESEVSRAFGGSVDRYYFRRLSQSLLEKEKQRLLSCIQPLDLAQLALALAQQEKPPPPQLEAPLCCERCGVAGKGTAGAESSSLEQTGSQQPHSPPAGGAWGAGAATGEVLEGGGRGGPSGSGREQLLEQQRRVLSLREEAALRALASLAVVAQQGRAGADSGNMGAAAAAAEAEEGATGVAARRSARPGGGLAAQAGTAFQAQEASLQSPPPQQAPPPPPQRPQQGEALSEGRTGQKRGLPEERGEGSHPEHKRRPQQQRQQHYQHRHALGPAVTEHAQHALEHVQRQVESLLAALAVEGEGPGVAAQTVLQTSGHAAAGECEGEEVAAAAGEAAGGRQPPAAAAAAAAAGAPISAAASQAPTDNSGSGGALLRVLLALQERQPEALRWLLEQGLSPAGWELLLGRLEQAEEEAAAAEGPQLAQERFSDFYDQMYSACPDREALLVLMLSRKEQFAQQALLGVLRDELAVHSARFA